MEKFRSNRASEQKLGQWRDICHEVEIALPLIPCFPPREAERLEHINIITFTGLRSIVARAHSMGPSDDPELSNRQKTKRGCKGNGRDPHCVTFFQLLVVVDVLRVIDMLLVIIGVLLAIVNVLLVDVDVLLVVRVLLVVVGVMLDVINALLVVVNVPLAIVNMLPVVVDALPVVSNIKLVVVDVELVIVDVLVLVADVPLVVA